MTPRKRRMEHDSEAGSWKLEGSQLMVTEEDLRKSCKFQQGSGWSRSRGAVSSAPPGLAGGHVPLPTLADCRVVIVVID